MGVVVMAGCARKAEEVVEEGEKSVQSWNKTLEMACRQWAEDRVPTLYLKQMMKAGEEELDKQLQQLQKVGSDQNAQRVVKKMQRLRSWLEQNQEQLSKADGPKRHQILATLPREGEG